MPKLVFNLHPLHRFAGRNSAIKKPKEIGVFSYDERRILKLDDSSLRTYYTPEIGSDLSGGFETFVKHDDSVDEHIDSLLTALIDIEKKTSKAVKPNFVTWRGMLTKIMCLPFDLRNGFEMNAIKYEDTIFIEENHQYKMGTQSRSKPDTRQELMSYWGYKFETLSTLPGIWDECSREMIESRSTEIVNNEAQFCSIVKTGFGNVSLVLGGEVDAVWDVKSDSQEDSNYVELKTTKQVTTPRDEVTFERKLLRFWSQSFLLGVGKIIVGERDNDGILLGVRELDTQGIPNIAKTSGRNLWDGKFSIDFTTTFLEWIRDNITEGGETAFVLVQRFSGMEASET